MSDGMTELVFMLALVGASLLVAVLLDRGR